MAQTLVHNYLHIVFSTKNREPFISRRIEEDLFAYMAGICQKKESFPVKVGGYRDHVHLLVNLSKKTPLIDLMQDLKAYSSKYVKSLGPELQTFHWQNGYGAFSVDYRAIDVVADYIANQFEHHNQRSFKEEYLELLKEHNLAFDERFLWD